MVLNPAYMGKAAFGKTERVERSPLLRPVRNRSPVPRSVKSGKRQRPKEEWTYIDVPAIVSPDVFAAAQEQISRNRRFAQRNAAAHRYLLQGLTVCARCGYGYTGKSVSRKPRRGDKLFYYRCTGRVPERCGGKAVCDNSPVRADELERYVWQSVCELLEEPGRLREEWTRRSAPDVDGVEQQQANALRLVRAHERALQRLVDAYEAGVLALDELKSRSDSVRKRIDRAREELATLEQLSEGAHELRSVVNKLEDFAKRVRNGLHRMPWTDRQKLVRTLVARIEINRDDVTIVYRLPGPRTKTGDRSVPQDRPATPAVGGEAAPAIANCSQKSASGPPGKVVGCVPPMLGAGRRRW
jgi:site-specific DNA recombinase